MSDIMTQEEAMNMSNEQAVQILIPMRNMMCDQNGCPISDAVFALDKAIEALSADRPQEWIPVSKTLPEEGAQVLVTDDAGGLATIDVDCGYFDEEYGRFEWFHSQNVTAWMPLPEPYKEKNESQRLQV